MSAVSIGFVGLMSLVALVDVMLWVSMPMGGAVYGVDLALTIVMAMAVVGARSLARRGQYEPAAWMLIGVLAARAIITIGVIVPEKIGMLAPGYLVVIVLAQVLLGGRAGIIAGLGCVPMFALAYATGDEMVLQHLPGVVSSSVFVYLTVAGFVDLALRHMEAALRRSNVLLVENERARTELQESEAQSRAITESSPTGIVIQQDGHLVYANPRFAQMAQCLQDDVFGLSLWDFFTGPDADALRAQLIRRREGTDATVRSDQLTFRPVRGGALWCEVAVVDVVYRNRDATLATILDVSDRVRAQLEVQRERDFSSNIINAADAIIMALDPEGRIVRFNPAGERILGYEEQELIGKAFWDVLVPLETVEASRSTVTEILHGAMRGQTEEAWLTKSGEERTISWRYVAQTSPRGDVSGVIAVGIDVTQQRLLEQQSIATERLRALGQMAGGVAHDLNNTLAGILGPAELLLQDEEDETRRQELGTIAAAAKRGSETVRRIQRFSQSRTDSDRQIFNLRELAEEVIHTLRPRWRDQAQREGYRIRVTDELADDLLVVGSSGEIGNVLTNLIVNACEAMTQGGAISIAGECDGTMTTFHVADTGCGMSPETMADIFHPFFSTKGADNSGLGLAVIRGIILRHGGTISVSSEPGEGTTFTVSLPAATPGEAVVKEPAHRREHVGALRVLVVDDSKPIADFASAALVRLGHEVTCVYDSSEALDSLVDVSYDMLLTDYGMEGLSGVSLAQEAKRLHPLIKTVIMTGWEFAEEEFGDVDASLSKPFTLGELEELIDQKLPW